MKPTILFTLIICTLIFQSNTGKAKPGSGGPRKHPRARNILWFHPNRVRVINGLAIGPFNFQSFRLDSALTVNGINIEAPGVGLFPLPVGGNYITVNGWISARCDTAAPATGLPWR